MFQCGVQWVCDVCFSVEYSRFVMLFQSVEYSQFTMYVSECGVQWVCDVHVLECGEQWVHDVCFRGWSTVGL